MTHEATSSTIFFKYIKSNKFKYRSIKTFPYLSIGNHGFPGDCTKTKFGCCSDKLTPKKYYDGRDCPRCEDKVPDLCEPHVSDCNEIGMVGNWMRTNCKKSCQVCIPDSEEGLLIKS